MTYAFSPHLAKFTTNQNAPGLPENYNIVALIDAGQLNKRARSSLAREKIVRPIFRESFGADAMELSPLLVGLDTDTTQFSQQIVQLDEICQNLPIVAILRSTLAMNALIFKLQNQLVIEVDGIRYLHRYADTQLLHAANTVFTPTQRAGFFSDIQSWWYVDHIGNLHNATLSKQEGPSAKLPLKLTDQQTHALLAATEVATLPCQIQKLEPSFGTGMSHAQRTGFVIDTLAAASAVGITNENGLVGWAAQQWRVQKSQNQQKL